MIRVRIKYFPNPLASSVTPNTLGDQLVKSLKRKLKKVVPKHGMWSPTEHVVDNYEGRETVSMKDDCNVPDLLVEPSK